MFLGKNVLKILFCFLFRFSPFATKTLWFILLFNICRKWICSKVTISQIYYNILMLHESGETAEQRFCCSLSLWRKNAGHFLSLSNTWPTNGGITDVLISFFTGIVVVIVAVGVCLQKIWVLVASNCQIVSVCLHVGLCVKFMSHQL